MNADSIPVSPADEAAAVESQARWPLILLAASGLLWFITGCVLAIIHSTQLHTPGFFAAHEWLGFGRVQAASESALLYGFVANCGFAVVWWLLGRLGTAAPRGVAAALVGVLFWNAGVSAGVVGILAGDLGPWALLQMPAYVVPLLGIAYAAFALAGFAAWLDRRDAEAFAAQWYAVAAILSLPWFYSAAYAMLHLYPVAGVSQAVVAAWAAEGLRLLWAAPIALGTAYYLLPKLGAQTLRGYAYADVGFWALILFAPWVGTRALAGSPVPVWIPTVGISCTLLLVLHYLVVAANLKGALSKAGGIPFKLVALGVIAYLLGGLADTVLAFRSLAERFQFTYLGEARFALLVFGIVAPVVFGALYYLMPRVTGRAWASEGLVRAHHRALLLGLLVLIVGLVGAALAQGSGLVATRAADGQVSALSFADIFAHSKPWLLIATHGLLLELIGGVLLLANFILILVPARADSGKATLAAANAS